MSKVIIICMLPSRVKHWVRFIPAVFLGLFVGRLISEQLRPGLGGAVAITIVTTVTSVILLRRQSIRLTWPLALSAFYVVYPEPDPRIIGLVIFLTAVTCLLNLQNATGSFRRPIPFDDRKIQAGILLVLAAGFLALYISTLSTDVLPADNGEFQLIAAELGVAHPPGFPLYTMLAYLMTRLPLNVSPAYAVNLFSALTSTATLILVYLGVHRLTGSAVAGITAVLALGTATTFWAQATTANIRSLTALFSAAAFYALIVLWDKQREEGPSKYALIPFILILSFGLTHHASLLFMGLVFLLFIILINRELLTNLKLWPVYVIAGGSGLLPLLYLLWRGAAGARGAPDDLTTLPGFLNHVLALGFRGDFFYFTEPGLLLERLRIMVNVLTFQFHPILLIGTAAGLALMTIRHWKLAVLLGGSFLLHTLITATYRAPQTVEYMIPAYVPLAICLGYSVGALKPIIRPLAVGVLLTAVLSQGLARLPSYQRLHAINDTRDFVQPLLEQAPANTVILADWHWATPLWYLQAVEGQRPDVSVQFVFPTAEPYEETWARRILEVYQDGHPVLATHYNEGAYAELPVWEPLGDAYLFSQANRNALPDGFTRDDIQLGTAVQISGHSLTPSTVEIGEEMLVTLAWRPLSPIDGVTLFAHLVGEDGRLYAQHDQAVTGREEGLTLTQFRLTPGFGAAPGEFSILVGAYGPDPLLDQDGESRTAVATVPVTAMNQRPYTDNPVYRTVPSGRPLLRLVGYDWDHTLETPRLYLHWQTEQGYQTEVRDNVGTAELNLPDWFGPWGIERQNVVPDRYPDKQYVPFGQGIVWQGEGASEFPKTASPGRQLTLRQSFFSSEPVMRDLVVSLRLVGYEPDGFHWAWWDLSDSVPALGAIPTLKWIGGSAVIDPHPVMVSEDATAGQQVGALLRIYDAFTGRPLPILDDRIGQEAPWVPVGGTVVGD